MEELPQPPPQLPLSPLPSHLLLHWNLSPKITVDFLFLLNQIWAFQLLDLSAASELTDKSFSFESGLLLASVTACSPGFPLTSLDVSFLSSLQTPKLPDHLLNAEVLQGSYNSVPPALISLQNFRLVWSTAHFVNSSRTACGHFRLNTFRSEFVVIFSNQPYLMCFKCLGITPSNCLTQEVWGRPWVLPLTPLPIPGITKSSPCDLLNTSETHYYSQFHVYPLYPWLLQWPCNWPFYL